MNAPLSAAGWLSRAVVSARPDPATPEGRAELARQAAAERAAEAFDAAQDHIAGGSGTPILTFGERVLANGWSFYPQERSGRRMPATLSGPGGGKVRWKPFQTKRPTKDDLSAWVRYGAADKNLTLIFGEASGDTFAIDVDVMDVDLSSQIEARAERYLGKSALRRVGRFPKVLLVYRQSREDASNLLTAVPSRSYRFAGEDGTASDDGLEILSAGKSATAFGYHHKTGRAFSWLYGMTPATVRPQDVPLVTADQVWAFLEAVQELKAFHRTATSTTGDSSWSYDPAAELYRPRAGWRIDDVRWVANDGGLVVDGREAYLFALSTTIVRRNENAARDPSDPQHTVLKALVRDSFVAGAVMDGQWTEQFLASEVGEKVDRLVREAIYHGRFARPVAVDPQACTATFAEKTAVERFRAEDPFVHILSHIRKQRAPINGIVDLDRDKGEHAVALRARLAEERRLRDADERQHIREKVRLRVRRRLLTWLQRVWKAVRAKRSMDDIVLLKAPPGAGKSTQLVELVAEMRRTHGPLGKPLAIMMPSHANLSEMMDRALGEKVGARDAWDADVRELTAAGKDAGLLVHVFKGRVAAGCLRAAEMRKLEEAGRGGGGLCVEQNPPEGQEPETCDEFERCPAIQQRLLVATADILLIPSAYLTCQVPAEVTQSVAALVIDERCWDLLVHTRTLPLSTLDIERAAPVLTKKQKEAGVTVEDLQISRRQLAGIVKRGYHDGLEPDVAIEKAFAGDRAKALHLVEDCLDLVKPSWNAARAVKPNMLMAAIDHLCGQARERDRAGEWRFWTILAERMRWLNAGTAKGSRDFRLQRISDRSGAPLIRMSWRSEPNFSEVPLLMLDASAEASIFEKCWPGCAVRSYTVDAPIHIRTVAMLDSTWADYTICPGDNSYDKQKRAAIRNVVLLRDLISSISAFHGEGMVLVGAGLDPRKALQADYAPPRNVSFSHFGALRGLNFAEKYTAAISIGRLELPVHVLDGLVAALTYDDESPEKPVDAKGDGTGKCATGIRDIAMRDGRTIRITDSIHSGRWARIVQRQYREEELTQFVGRLRGVHREGDPAVWYVAARCIPEGVIVDDVCTVSDVARPHHAVHGRIGELPRRAGGIFDTNLSGSYACDIMGGKEGQDRALERFEIGKAQSRIRRGLVEATYQFVGDESYDEHKAYVPAYLPPEQAVVDAWAKHGVMVEVLDWTPSEADPAPAPRKAPDKVDRLVADLPDGATLEAFDAAMVAKEADLRERAVQAVLRDHGGVPPNFGSVILDPANPRERGSLDERMLALVHIGDPVASEEAA